MNNRRSWTDVIQTLREHKCQPRLQYPAKLSITLDGETKVFHDKTKFTHYLSTNPALQRIIGVEESKDSQVKGPINIFNKIIEENFPNLKKEMPMNIQEAYRTPNRLDEKRNSS